MKIKNAKYLLLMFFCFIFAVCETVFGAGGGSSQQNQLYPINLSQISREDNTLRVRYSISASDADYIECYGDDKVIASTRINGNGDLTTNISFPYYPESYAAEGEIEINVPNSNVVYITIESGFCVAEDDNGNIIGKSSTIRDKRFVSEGVFGNLTITKESRQNDTLLIKITSDIPNANDYTYDYHVSKVKVNDRLGHSQKDGDLIISNDNISQRVSITGISGTANISVEPGFFVAHNSDSIVGYSKQGVNTFTQDEPEMTISEPEIGDGHWNGDTLENVEVSFHIEGYDSSMNVEIDDSKINVYGGIPDTDPQGILDEDNGYVDYTFSILNVEDSAELVIDTGAIKIGNKESAPGNKTFTKSEEEEELANCTGNIESFIGGQSGCVAYTGNGNWWCNTPAGYRLYLENNQEYTKIAESQRMKILLYLQKYNEEHDDKLDIDLTEVGNINSDVISGVQKLLGMTVNSCGSKKTYDTYFQYPFCSSIYSGTNLSAQELNDQGTCDDGFYKDPLYDCCIKYQSFCDMATGYMRLDDKAYSGYIGVVCEPCLAGTKPNDDHSDCICDSDNFCCGIELYVGIPFIGDCIEMNSYSARPDTTTVTNTSAFPVLMQGLMKIVMSVILVVSFLLVIVSGLMMTAGAFKSTSFDKGKTLIKNVIISLILLGLSGLILKLINPSFFGGF